MKTDRFIQQLQLAYKQPLLPGLDIAQKEYLQEIHGDAVSSFAEASSSEIGLFGGTLKSAAFVEKIWSRIVDYRLMAICVVIRSSQATTMTFCNVWQLIRHQHEQRIILSEFSSRTGQWSEKAPNAM